MRHRLAPASALPRAWVRRTPTSRHPERSPLAEARGSEGSALFAAPLPRAIHKQIPTCAAAALQAQVQVSVATRPRDDNPSRVSPQGRYSGCLLSVRSSPRRGAARDLLLGTAARAIHKQIPTCAAAALQSQAVRPDGPGPRGAGPDEVQVSVAARLGMPRPRVCLPGRLRQVPVPGKSPCPSGEATTWRTHLTESSIAQGGEATTF